MLHSLQDLPETETDRLRLRPLGLQDAKPEVCQTRLEHGDRLLLYTDGITEARSPSGEFFGEQRLADHIISALAAGDPAPETVRRLMRSVLTHQADQLQDDASIVVLEWLTGDIEQPFDDARPSIAVPFTSSQWGSLASFGARRWPGTKKYYGTSGNSFVAVVEFGDSVRARAVSAGGESGDPRSRHFNDQAVRYSTGDLREVYFYPSQLRGHTERVYQPGR